MHIPSLPSRKGGPLLWPAPNMANLDSLTGPQLEVRKVDANFLGEVVA